MPQRLSFLSLIGWTTLLAAAEQPPVQAPEGFVVTRYAGDDLAPDIFCMTLDSQGRVVVSGPGYVRILIDSDGDGVADRFQQFVDGPKTGAQGMTFYGRDLICVGDAGLLRYRDGDGDDRADGPPDVFLKIKTGGEHHAHAIRRGPDGWWYLMAGNFAGVGKSYITLPTSPVRVPQAGTLLRLSPTLNAAEVYAHGFRNAYDFAFNAQGDIVTYDSDSERGISLPWYEPTRAFHVLPASHAGWVTLSWSRPDSYADMPPVLGAFGRGSPTGVACYRHTLFPEKYRDAMFLLDWTYGRVILLPLTQQGSSYASQPENFLTARGEYGFAPTDIEVAPDGSLFVSVGGRGTQGAVYRITYPGGKAELPWLSPPPKTSAEKLRDCLDAPQPLASWSRAWWEPTAKELGREPFLEAALNGDESLPRRLRAVEILTHHFQGLTSTELARFAPAKAPELRARAVWSLGRAQGAKPDAVALLPFLRDDHPLAVRCALEVLLSAGPETDFRPLLPTLAQTLRSKDRYVQQTAMRTLRRLPAADVAQVATLAQSEGSPAVLAAALGTVNPPTPASIDRYPLALGGTILRGEYPPALKLQAVRLLLLALGDMGPLPPRPAVYDGYGSLADLAPHDVTLDNLRLTLAEVFPTGEEALDRELGRLAAMVELPSPKVLSETVRKLTPDAHPLDDLHWLIVASRIPLRLDAAQQTAVANALVRLEDKIRERKLVQDSHWEDRVGEMYRQLAKTTPELVSAVVRQERFGRPGHMLFLAAAKGEDKRLGLQALSRAIRADAEYPWTSEVVFALGQSADPADLELIRGQFDNFGVRPAVLLTLSKNPQPADRALFVRGLDTAQGSELDACIQSLESFPAATDVAEQFALLRAIRRLNSNEQEYAQRERLVRLLQRNAGQTVPFQFGKPGHQPQREAVEQWTALLTEQYPRQALGELGGQSDLEALKTQLAQTNWEQGDAVRGRKLFELRACARCHGGRGALGPELSGVGQRFSRDDLFAAIAAPNRDVSTRYRAQMIQAAQGRVHTGMIVYESVDGLLLRDASHQTIRIEARDIEMRRTLTTSLMPAGLLKDLTGANLADLYAYLRSLGANAN